MAQVSKPSERTIMLFTSEDSQQTKDFRTQLQMPGYQVRVETNGDRARRVLNNGHKCDAVIAFNSPDYPDLFRFVRNQAASHSHPLLVLISEDVKNLDSDILSATDLILPPHPAYIRSQLQTLMKLQQRNTALILEKKVAEEEILRLQTELNVQIRDRSAIELLKNAIVRNVSHELKTPLLQVKSAVSLIAEDVSDKKLIRYAENATARLEAIVKNITMLGSSLDINLSPVILRDAVEYARRNMGRVWQRRDEADRIKLEITNNLPPVLADKQGLSTVLQLLMDNAIKFSDQEVVVRARQEEDEIIVSIHDKGIGIAADKLSLIFDTFYQIDSSSTRRYGGTGVGLALVKLILDHHNTQIEVDSRVGKGSTFSFKLKVVDLSH